MTARSPRTVRWTKSVYTGALHARQSSRVLRQGTLVGVLVLLSGGAADAAQERVAVRGSALRAPGAVAKLLDPYRGTPDSAKVGRTLEKLAGAAAFPRLPEDGILEARLWRLAERPRLALAILDSLTAPRVQPLRSLERARVLLESEGDSDVEAGAQAWWAACDRMDRLTRAEITTDIRPLTTPEERTQWRELGWGEEACDWLRDFWTDRAQRMAITLDERLALHYRRLAHARDGTGFHAHTSFWDRRIITAGPTALPWTTVDSSSSAWVPP